MAKDDIQGLALQKMFVSHCIEEIPKDSKKSVHYVMKGNGLWQVRKNKIGTFYIHQSETKIPGLRSDLNEGWELDVPLIPPLLLKKAIAFFKAIYKEYQTEAHVQFFYNTIDEEYILHCPKQKVTGGSVSYKNDKEFETPEKILVLEMHSHGSMPAFFSSTDDGDEKDDRFFGVVGKIEQYNPEIKMRLSVGGQKMDIDVDDIFDIEGEMVEEFPKEWMRRVKKQEIKTITVKRFPRSGFSNRQIPMHLFEQEGELFGDLTSEMEKAQSGDYLYPTDAFIPEEGEYYVQEGDKKWFVQDGEKIFYIDKFGQHHLAEDEDNYEDDDLDWRTGRF